jgi:short-subunit dehydrogenase involved in D-alanine esterification of teichoic acids
MTDKHIWFITGAVRGMGIDLAKAALAAGNAVVATGRNSDTVTKAVGESDNLLVVKLPSETKMAEYNSFWIPEEKR